MLVCLEWEWRCRYGGTKVGGEMRCLISEEEVVLKEGIEPRGENERDDHFSPNTKE